MEINDRSYFKKGARGFPGEIGKAGLSGNPGLAGPRGEPGTPGFRGETVSVLDINKFISVVFII